MLCPGDHVQTDSVFVASSQYDALEESAKADESAENEQTVSETKELKRRFVGPGREP
jgi:hypothetical protein